MRGFQFTIEPWEIGLVAGIVVGILLAAIGIRLAVRDAIGRGLRW
jgi:uncharacterized membrane-anchored protein YhcB (DUF1043 family)